MTVAMILAHNGIVPPEEWLHNKYLKDNLNRTVCDYLFKNNIENIPQEWNTYKEIQLTDWIE